MQSGKESCSAIRSRKSVHVFVNHKGNDIGKIYSFKFIQTEIHETLHVTSDGCCFFDCPSVNDHENLKR